MRGQARLFDIDERLKEISAKGDVLKRLMCRAVTNQATGAPANC